MKGIIPHYPGLSFEKPGSIVYHYTSPAVFLSIISKKTLWFSRCDCLNDYKDGEIVKELYPRCISELSEEGLINCEFFNSAKCLIIKHLHWIVNDTGGSGLIECRPFVCCFSKESDSLQMWQYYSKNGDYEGYNIGFNISDLLNINPIFIRDGNVIYSEDEQKSLIKHAILTNFKYYSDNWEENSVFFKDKASYLNYCVSQLYSDLAKLSCFFKRSCFEGEKEVRVVIDTPIDRKYRNEIWISLEAGKTFLPINYRIHHAMMVPYIEVKINPKSIKNITIGPITSSKDEGLCKNYEVIQEFVRDNLCQNVEIDRSSIPIRF